jgi:acyl-CoA thioesterase
LKFAEASHASGGPGLWSAELVAGWDIFGVTNGGYLMSIATRAMAAECDGRILISSTASYVNPASAGQVDVRVETLKHGKSLSTLRATISRSGKDLVYVTGVFSDPARPASEQRLLLSGPPELPPPDECVTAIPSETDAPFPPPFVGKVDLRIHPEDANAIVGEKTGVPLMRGWFRLRDDEPMDMHAVVMATDAFPPAIFNSELNVGWTPTVDLTVQVRNPGPTGWLACRFATRFVTDGLLEEDGELWDEAGEPVAFSRQLALVPR